MLYLKIGLDGQKKNKSLFFPANLDKLIKRDAKLLGYEKKKVGKKSGVTIGHYKRKENYHPDTISRIYKTSGFKDSINYTCNLFNDDTTFNDVSENNEAIKNKLIEKAKESISTAVLKRSDDM